MVFHKKLFLTLLPCFLLLAVVGVLSHEAGHYLMSRYYGFKEAHISYGYTKHGSPNSVMARRNAIEEQYANEIENNIPFNNTELNALNKELSRERFYITAAGPLETILVGTIGFILLIRSVRRSPAPNNLSGMQWVYVFLSMFWLRSFVNVCMDLLRGHHSTHGNDEMNLAQYLGLPELSIYIATGVVGAIVTVVVIARLIPSHSRFTFVCALLPGGVLGMWLWIGVIGPVIMP